MTVTQKRQSEERQRPSQVDATAKQEMAEKYLPLVRFVAEKIHRRLPPSVDLESLIHSGVVGLLEALERFDPKRGVEFEIYARYRIRGEVMQCLRSLDWVSRSVRSWGRKMEAARAKLVAKLIREPNADEMAKELMIPLKTYFRLDQQVNDATLLNLEDLSIASAADWECAQEKYSQTCFPDPFNSVEVNDLIVKLNAAVENLPERQRMIMTLYYHEERTLREIGEILNLSEGRICQIFGQVLTQLRDALGVNDEQRCVQMKRCRDKEVAFAVG